MKKILKSNDPNKCINPFCDLPRKSRGLCIGCYQTINRLIRKGILTDAQAVAGGKFLPGERNRNSPKLQWLYK